MKAQIAHDQSMIILVPTFLVLYLWLLFFITLPGIVSTRHSLLALQAIASELYSFKSFTYRFNYLLSQKIAPVA